MFTTGSVGVDVTPSSPSSQPTHSRHKATSSRDLRAALLAKDHGVMVNSGSSAIKLAIEVLDLAPGDEIVTPAVTFGTDIAPIVQAGLVPVFVDVDPTTFQVDALRLEEMVGPRTRAL